MIRFEHQVRPRIMRESEHGLHLKKFVSYFECQSVYGCAGAAVYCIRPQHTSMVVMRVRASGETQKICKNNILQSLISTTSQLVT